jgi:hypothetical protein
MNIEHATREAYEFYACRCDECLAWKRKHRTPATHGLTWYANGRCRCDVCRTAWREYQRQYRAQPYVKARVNEQMRTIRRLARLAREAGIT